MGNVPLMLKKDLDGLEPRFRAVILSKCGWNKQKYNIRKRQPNRLVSELEKRFLLDTADGLLYEILDKYDRYFTYYKEDLQKPPYSLRESHEGNLVKYLSCTLRHIRVDLRDFVAQDCEVSEESYYRLLNNDRFREIEKRVFFNTARWLLNQVLIYNEKSRTIHDIEPYFEGQLELNQWCHL